MDNDKLVTLVFENRCLWDMKDKNYNRECTRRMFLETFWNIPKTYLVDSKVHEISCDILRKCLLKQTLHSHVHFFHSKVIFLTKDYPKSKNHERYPSCEQWQTWSEYAFIVTTHVWRTVRTQSSERVFVRIHMHCNRCLRWSPWYCGITLDFLAENMPNKFLWVLPSWTWICNPV
jgi:hypothetical protein